MEFIVQYESSSGNLVHKQKSCFIVGSSVPIARSQVTVFITGFQEKKRLPSVLVALLKMARSIVGRMNGLVIRSLSIFVILQLSFKILNRLKFQYCSFWPHHGRIKVYTMTASLTDSENVCIWKPTLQGGFSTASICNVCRKARNHMNLRSQIWYKFIHGKSSILMCRLLQQRVPLNDRLKIIWFQLTSKCVCCKSP